MIIETTNVVISNGSGNSGTVGTGEAVEVGIKEGDDVRVNHPKHKRYQSFEPMYLFSVKCFYFLKLHHRKRSGMN